MGIFDKLFGKKKKDKLEEHKPIPDQDQDSGYEPIPRYPGSVMIQHSVDSTSSAAKRRVYIEYECMGRFDAPAYWYMDQMESSGWKLEAWSPPRIINRDLSGTTGFISLVYEKEEKRCDIGTKYRTSHTKIWIDYQEY